MPRYDGSTNTPRSKTRRSTLRRRRELDRSKKDRPYYREEYFGYAHGVNGPSGSEEANDLQRDTRTRHGKTRHTPGQGRARRQ